MANTKPTDIKAAGNPFNKPDADAILRSSDKVEYHVHRLILSIASPTFADMFGLPQSGDDPKPVVDLAEDSETLQVLLDAIYPLREPATSNLDRLDAVLTAALKYDMSKVQEYVRRRVVAFASTEPLRAFAVACRAGSEQAAKSCAQNLDWAAVDGVYVRELEQIPAACYHRLLHFCGRRTGWDSITFINHHDGNTIALKTSRSNRPTIDADFPFNDPNSDVAIITADQYRFLVIRNIVALCSSVLGDQISLAETLVSTSDRGLGESLIEIHVPENSDIFRPLLQLCYPNANAPSLPLDTTRSMCSMFECAKKYRMDKAVSHLESHWDTFIRGEPLHAYLVASSAGWRLQAISAANYFLLQSIDELRSIYTRELETSLAGPYFRLLRYHNKCSAAIRAKGKAIASWDPNPKTYRNWCNKCARENWIERDSSTSTIVDELIARPSSLTMTTAEGRGHRRLVVIAASKCGPFCVNITKISHMFGTVVDGLVAQVDLESND